MATTTPGNNRAGNVPPYSGRNAAATAGMLFAGVILVLNGALGVLQGIAAIAKDSVYAVGLNYAYRFNVTSWGWIHVVLGVALAVVGVSLMTGATWARWAGVFIAAVSLALQFMFLPYYPLWALVVIALDFFVIWALVAWRGVAES
jgi:hypothetical protein